MFSKNKKILLALGTLATIVAPVSAVVACGDGSPSPKIDHAKIFGQYVAANVKGKAPSAFEHFKLPSNFPKAPENTHYEFNNDEIYNLTKDANGKGVEYWTPNFENFVMVPYFSKDKTTFKVKLVADKGYTLSGPLEFSMIYDTELLSWDDPEISKDKVLFVIKGPTKSHHFSSVDEAIKGMGESTQVKVPDADQQLTMDDKGTNVYLNLKDFKAVLEQKDRSGDPLYKITGAKDNSEGTFLRTNDGKTYAYYASVPTHKTTHWTRTVGYDSVGVPEDEVLQVGHSYEVQLESWRVGGLAAAVVLKVEAGGNIKVKPVQNFAKDHSAEGTFTESNLKVGDSASKDVTVDDILKKGLDYDTFFGPGKSYTFPGISDMADDQKTDATLSIGEISADESGFTNADPKVKITDPLSYWKTTTDVEGKKLLNPGFFENEPKTITDAPFWINENNYTNIVELSTYDIGQDTTIKFHKYNRDKDMAKDLGVTIITLNRPISVKDTLEVDGRIVRAKSNRFDTPKSSFGTEVPGVPVVAQADSIY